MTFKNIYQSTTLAIALGANLPSSFGSPISTLIKIRPNLERVIREWISSIHEAGPNKNKPIKNSIFKWSPLFETLPIKGSVDQPKYTNAALLVSGGILELLVPSETKAIDLLGRLLKLEEEFDRNRKENALRWGPRSIDIDLLFWGSLQVKSKDLILPHPRVIERSFVLVPLAAASTKGDAFPPKEIQDQNGWLE